MARVTLSARAAADLDDIWLNVAQDDADAADRLVDHITARFHLLEAYPYLGPARPEIDADARMLVIGRYLALYQVAAERVTIIRVAHGARRLEELFDTDNPK